MDVKGLEQLRDALKGMERQIPFAASLGLNKLAYAVKADVEKELATKLDRPTPYVLGGLFVQKATKTRLEAVVAPKTTSKGRAAPVADILRPQVMGGMRDLHTKAFERGLRKLGAMGPNELVVPGPGCELDEFGNPSRKQLRVILNQLSGMWAAKYQAKGNKGRAAAEGKAGGTFFVLRKGGKPGIYQREMFGRNITPVFLFKTSVTYRERIDLKRVAQGTVDREAEAQFAAAINEAVTSAIRK